MRSVLLISVLVAMAGCAHDLTPIGDGAYYAYDMQNNLSPDEPAAIWFDKHVLTVRNGNVELRTSPGYVLHGRVTSSASDGGFRTYDGAVELSAGRAIMGLRQLTCDYCQSLDGPLPSKRLREYVVIHHDDGSFEVDHVRYYADPLWRPYWIPVPGDSGDRFAQLFTFGLGETGLDFIEDNLGTAEQYDLEYSDFAICYQLSHPGITVTFESSRWFGGKERRLLGFSVATAESSPYPCTDLLVSADDLEVGGVRLGMGEAEFRDLVGEPLETRSEGSLRREFVVTRLATERELSRFSRRQREVLDGTIDVWLAIEGSFERGVLTRFRVHRSEYF